MTSKYPLSDGDGSVRLSTVSEGGPYLRINNLCLTRAGILPGEWATVTVRRLQK